MSLMVLVIPLAGALLFLFIKQKSLMHILNGVLAFLLLGMSYYLTSGVLASGVITHSLFGSFFYLDALNLMVLDTILLVSFFACIYSAGYLDEEYKHGILDLKRIKLYYSLTYTFIFTMVLVVTTQNLGLMWIAIEATTLASVLLVGFYSNRRSIEAAWKYVIICSVGIAMALLGVIFFHFSAVKGLPGIQGSLNWSFLYQNAAYLDPSVLKIAFLFILVGFGTKVGLVPLHTWLPDAHSQAPSPISALLSGVLLNSAMYGIIRALAIVNKNLGMSWYTGRLLIAMGLLSMAAAAIIIITQKDYKRLLAYSSIEHMGILAFALGIFTPAAVFGAMFHMINHSFTKSMLFLASGNIYLKYKTREIAKVTGLIKTMPWTGTVFLLGLLAIAGTPPFSVFASELNITLASFAAERIFLGSVFILLIALVFCGIAATLLKMPFGRNENSEILPGEINRSGLAVIVVMLVIILITGIYIPVPLKTLLDSASRIIMGG